MLTNPTKEIKDKVNKKCSFTKYNKIEINNKYC